MTAIFLQGNAIERLRNLPSDFIHCGVTSPPYFGLRKYDGGEEVWDGDVDCDHEWGVDQPVRHKGQVEQTKWKNADGAGSGQTTKTGNFCAKCGAWKGQLGGEPTPDLYIRHLIQIMREVRRVLRPDGVCFVNIGDSWCSTAPGTMGDSLRQTGIFSGVLAETAEARRKFRPATPLGAKPLDTVLIPSLLALALREDGWYVRSQIIWSKNNPMPESVNGVRFERHRVKVGNYAKMRSMWQTKYPNEDWPFSLQGVPTSKSTAGQVSVQPQLERKKSSPRVVSCTQDTTPDSEIDGGGTGTASQRERATKESEAGTDCQTEGVPSSVSSYDEGSGNDGKAECSSLCLGNGHRQSFNGRAVVGDSGAARVSVSLLPEEDEIDNRPCNPVEQGWEAHSGQRGSSVHELQQQKTRQDSDEFIDCPGCSKCSPNDGYVLRKGSWRPTDSHEIILMLTKTNHYFCDREAVIEPIAPSTVGRGKVDFGGKKGRDYNPDETDPNFSNGSEQWGRTYAYTQSNGNGGHTLRSVWQFPTKPGKFSHYAAYPPKLPEICLKSSTSEKGCCPKCGSPWARVVDKPPCPHTGHTEDKNPDPMANGRRIALMRQAAREAGHEYDGARASTIGWRPTCTCGSNLSPISCRVLDPFSGAGTTAMVAEQLGLDSFSIDTSAEYIQLSKDRIADDKQRQIDEFIKRAKQAARRTKNGK